MLVITERTKLLLGACCKLKYMVSEKEVGCDNIDNDDKGDIWSR